MVHDRSQIDPTNEISAFRINKLHVVLNIKIFICSNHFPGLGTIKMCLLKQITLVTEFDPEHGPLQDVVR